MPSRNLIAPIALGLFALGAEAAVIALGRLRRHFRAKGNDHLRRGD